MVLRPLVRLPLGFVSRRAHREAAPRDRDHIETAAGTERFGECCGTIFFRRAAHALLVDSDRRKGDRVQRRSRQQFSDRRGSNDRARAGRSERSNPQCLPPRQSACSGEAPPPRLSLSSGRRGGDTRRCRGRRGRLFQGDPLDRLVRLRIDRRYCDHPPPQLLCGFEVTVRLGLQRVDLDRADIRQCREFRHQDQMQLLDRLGMGVGRLARLAVFGAEFGYPKPEMQVQPFDRRAIGLALQAQSFQEAIGKGPLL